VTFPHISWLKHGSHAETALVGSVVIGRVALEGDLWTWHASLPHGDLLADHGSCETERRAKEHLEDFLKLWLEPFRPLWAQSRDRHPARLARHQLRSRRAKLPGEPLCHVRGGPF
jgi:succinylarginine dihydrolase